MTLHIPERLTDLDGYGKPHTVRAIAVSARSGLAYCEIAPGASGRQKTWYPAALYRPPLIDHAYHRPGEDTYEGMWRTVGIIKPTVHRPGQFVLWAHRWFNPGPPLSAKLVLNAQSDARVLMETILEKWYG